jgi:hypothetical protein
VQLSIEREVGTLVLMREERMTKSSGGRSTASLVQRMNFRRRKIRQLRSQWEAWKLVETTADSFKTALNSIIANGTPYKVDVCVEGSEHA